MPTAFSAATAEQVIAAVQAVCAKPGVNADFVGDFGDMPASSAEAALRLAADLGLVTEDSGKFSPHGPLCHLTQLPDVPVRAAVLRVALESYEPFRVFRARLTTTRQTSLAAAQTKVTLDLDAHRDDISQTLISLGTFARALTSEGGGHHRPDEEAMGSSVMRVAAACSDLSAAEQQVRLQLSPSVADKVSFDEVIQPLANALVQAHSSSDEHASSAVMNAGNAVESYLVALAGRQSINLSGASGIGSKIDRFAQAAFLPAKVQAIGRYLGQVRNAADHGIDSAIGESWAIRPHSAHEYTSIAMSFISACDSIEEQSGYVI